MIHISQILFELVRQSIDKLHITIPAPLPTKPHEKQTPNIKDQYQLRNMPSPPLPPLEYYPAMYRNQKYKSDVFNCIHPGGI